MGTVTVNLPSDGTTADVSDINNPINAIVKVINGGLDNDNIKAGAGIDGAKLANSSTPASKIDFTTFVNRQDNSTNSTVAGVKIQQGWGFEPGIGLSHTAGKAVTFPVAFTNPPIVVTCCVGYKDSTDPTTISDFSKWEIPQYNAYGVTNTGFSVVAGTMDNSNLASTRRVGYSWIAIGT